MKSTRTSLFPLPTRRWLAAFALLAVLAGCAGGPPPAAPQAAAAAGAPAPAMAAAREALAPTGALRVGVYRGSPSSYVAGEGGAPARGVGYLLGQAFAQQLGVPFEPVVFAKNADVLAAVREGRVDLVFTNATPERARTIDFSPAVLDVEKSVLVPAASPFGSLDALRGRPVRIGVSVGSSTGTELARVYPAVRLEPVPTLQQAAKLLAQGGIDGFATNKAILFELADQVPGARVLPGAWGYEHFAIGIPQGRAGGRAFLERFAREAAAAGGVLQRAVEQSRLRGTVAPQS